MNKKIIALIIAIVIIVAGVSIYLIINKGNDQKQTNNSNNNQQEQNKNNENNNGENTSTDKKIAVIYFSATGTTKKVAQTISSESGGTLIEIVPKEKYTSADLNWNDSKSRTSIECNDKNSRPEIANTIDVEDYDVIYLGYPIWWADVPHIILTFIDTHKLDGKTIIPFATSGGSGIGGSVSTLKEYNKNVNWNDGKLLNGSEDSIRSWVKGLNY